MGNWVRAALTTALVGLPCLAAGQPASLPKLEATTVQARLAVRPGINWARGSVAVALTNGGRDAIELMGRSAKFAGFETIAKMPATDGISMCWTGAGDPASDQRCVLWVGQGKLTPTTLDAGSEAVVTMDFQAKLPPLPASPSRVTIRLMVRPVTDSIHTPWRSVTVSAPFSF